MLIGLVGKSCSGKNYVAEIMESRGWLVWDLDKIAHDVLDQSTDALIETFGENSVKKDQNGKIVADRKAIGAIVFGDAEKLSRLEAILYPTLMQKIMDFDKQNPDRILVLNGALLHRGGLDKVCRAAIYVDASYDVRLKRALSRDGIGAEAFQKRENSQQDVDFRDVTYACRLFIIDNNNDIFKKNTHSVSEFKEKIFQICDRISLYMR